MNVFLNHLINILPIDVRSDCSDAKLFSTLAPPPHFSWPIQITRYVAIYQVAFEENGYTWKGCSPTRIILSFMLTGAYSKGNCLLLRIKVFCSRIDPNFEGSQCIDWKANRKSQTLPPIEKIA